MLLVAPIGAVVIVAALLIFGIKLKAVFAPGWAFLTLLRSGGIHAPNAVGILGTVGAWWLLLVYLGMLWERRRRGSGP